MPPLRYLATALVALLLVPLFALAQSPRVPWNVSTYGPDGAPAAMGCGGCTGDQRNIAVDAQGNVFVSGFTDTVTDSDMLLVKYNGATGAVLWQKTYNGTGDASEQAWALALDPSGNAIITGYAWNELAGEYDFKTIKFASSDGTILWQNTFTGPAAGIDFGLAIGTDAAGNVYAAGMVFNGSNDDAKILKLAALTGAVIWDKTFSGVAGFNDFIYALTVDSAGNVIVTGEEQLNANDSNWKTIKYAASDGAILWQKSYGHAAGGLDIPHAIQRDAANDVVVVGVTFNGATRDGKVIKYSGANGAVLWEKTHSNSEFGDDFFYSVALDAAGNAVVAGFSFNDEAGQDWVVNKYASANGAVMWSKLFGSVDGGADVAVAVSIDAQGNVVAGGRFDDSGDTSNRDMGVIKISGADGSLLWRYVYAGGAGVTDRVAGVVASGNAVFIAGESVETGSPRGLRVARLEDPMRAAPPDLNADGHSDLVFQHTDGRVAAWLMSGTHTDATANLLGAGTGWTVTHLADLDGDGNTDILFHHTDGRTYAYRMNGLAVAGGKELLGAGLGWSVTHAADFNGDGKADLLLRHTDGRVFVWLMDGTNVIGSANLLPAASGWRVVATGDFNADGKADIVFMHDDGRAYMYLMNGTTVTAGVGFLSAGSGWTVTHAPDFDGDGKADLLFRHTDGRSFLYLMNGTTFGAGASVLGPGTGWTVTHAGDLNGDGKADLVFQHTDGRAHARLMNGTGTLNAADVLPAGSGWSVTQLQDFNGDGKKDFVFRHADGRITIRLMDGLNTISSANLITAGGWSVVPPAP